MRSFVLLLFLIPALLGPAASLAQEAEDDGGYIENLLERALSAEGRDVRLEGFRGALSSTAEIDRIVITDPDGIWLTAEDISMQWRRAALLRGRIEIDEIRVGRLSLPRPPLPAPQEAPTPEARGPISLPDLPVSIQLGALTLVTAEIGAPVLGQAVTIGASGSANLADGEGAVELDVTRQDREGRFRVAGGFSNETRVLSVDVTAQEPEGGLVASLMNLPDTPSLDLAVAGAGPLDDFAADLALATDGADRLTGRVTLQGADETAGTPGQRFDATLAGDIRPLVEPVYHDFLGDDLRLEAAGLQAEDGSFALDRLRLRAEALALEGTAAIGADGFPERFDIDLEIGDGTGTPVVLPVPGAATELRSAALAADFDAARGSGWTLRGDVTGFAQPGVALSDVTLDASGTIDRDAPAVDGVLDLVAGGVALDDPALQTALGERLSAALRVAWRPDAPIRISDIALAGADYALTGTLDIDGVGGALGLDLRPDLALEADRLARFAALSGLDLSGAARLAIAGSVTPLEGGFDLTLDGTTRDLALGIPEADALLAGESRIDVDARRDTGGLSLPRLDIETDAARITGAARIAQGDTEADLRAVVADTSVVAEGLSGPAEIDLTASGQGSVWRVDGTVAAPGETALALAGTIDTGQSAAALSTVTIDGSIGDLSVFSALAGQPLSGRITLDAEASGTVSTQSGTLRLDGRATDLQTGIAQVDGLVRGASEIALLASREADGTIRISRLGLDAAGFTAQGAGEILGDQPGTITLNADLPDMAPLLPGLDGPGALDLTATTEGTTWDVTGTVALPGQTALDVSADLDIAGAAESVATVAGRIGDLSAFSGLAGQALSGAVTLDATARGDLAAQTGTLALDGGLASLSTGIPQVDALMRGDTALRLRAERRADGAVVIDLLDLDGPGITADGSGQLLGDAPGQVSLDLRLPDLGPLVPVLPGPAALTLDATQRGARWQVTADASAPGGTSLTGRGTVAADVSDVDLSLTGNAPLAIANAFLDGQTVEGPVSFDLSVDGAPGLDAVSGTVTIGETRVAAPALQLVLERLRGTVRLGGGRAQIALDSRFADGGTVSLSGPVTLSAPFSADLEVALRDAILRQADLVETRVNGTVTLDGALTGGAAIGGELLLDPVEVQIPNIGPSYAALEGLSHTGLPADVRQTLLSAKLLRTERRGAGVSYPIDLLIRAPQRIFVRGRGLDAELGGQIRITGRTDAMVPVGSFELRRGTLDLLTRDLALDVGNIDIQGNFDPVIEFAASSTVEGVEITIGIEGPASDPQIALTSVPELPEDEVLSLFLFGSRIDNISPLQAVRLATAARTLSGAGGLGFRSVLRDNLGVDSFDFNVDAEGVSQATVGAYISENIYTDLTVNSEGESEVELNLELTDTTVVRGRSDTTGSSAVGIFFERDY